MCARKIEKRIITSPFMETSPTLFNVYSFEDLLSRKIVTLFNRLEGKDIYDVFHALDLKIDFSSLHNAIKILLHFYRSQHNVETFLGELKTKLEDAKKRYVYIGNATNHFIPRGLRPEWGIFIDSLILKIVELKSKL
ncbi:MAG: nucleotidyl transferase AbiEii/AbiGii toxin family protein [Thermoplasmatales archaeon]|nr:nucleotidyl transferase AbiEii/AbiGii toxin family protein [Thermoplasmatales archaeon]